MYVEARIDGAKGPHICKERTKQQKQAEHGISTSAAHRYEELAGPREERDLIKSAEGRSIP
jgi:hypothetical protein